jgi:hypothetical protein
VSAHASTSTTATNEGGVRALSLAKSFMTRPSWKNGIVSAKAITFDEFGALGRYAGDQSGKASLPETPIKPNDVEAPAVLPTELPAPPEENAPTEPFLCTSSLVGGQKQEEWGACPTFNRLPNMTMLPGQVLTPQCNFKLERAARVSPLKSEEYEWMKTRSCTANCLPLVQSNDDDASSRVSTLKSMDSSSTGMSLETSQEELIISLKNRGMEVIFVKEHPNGVRVDAKPGTKAICVVTPVPSTHGVQEIIRTLVGQQSVLPMVVLLLQPSMSSRNSSSASFVKETKIFFDMGVDDVLLQPSSDRDIEDVVDMCLCRLDHQSNLLRSAAAREAELFWKSVHRIFPNLPRMSSTVGEPTVGNKFGNNHEVVKKINSGKTATVYLALDKRTNAPRALKAMPKANMENFSIVRDVDKEVSILKRLSHPNIVTLLGEAHSTEHLNLLMEFAGHRNMFHLMRSKEHGRLSAEETRCLFAQVVDALTYCHGEHVAHRDLKPENIAISDDGTTAKLVDFGFADELSAPLRHVGTMPFIAPEVMMQDLEIYSATAADVWALGVVLVEMLCGVNTLPRILGWQKTGVPKKKSAEDLIQLLSETGKFQDAIEVKIGKALIHNGDFLKLLNGMLCVCVPERWASTKIKRSRWLAPD